MTSIERIRVGAEWSGRHGAYALAHATSIGAECRDVDFDTFYRILVNYGATGGYAKEAIRRAFNRGRLP